MKRFTSTLICLAFFTLLMGQNPDQATIQRASQHFMQLLHPGSSLQASVPLTADNGEVVGLLSRFSPSGFLIVSTSMGIRPVYAYSCTNDFVASEPELQTIRTLITTDLQHRILLASRMPSSETRLAQKEWDAFLMGNLRMNPFQQWPPEGSTTTEGWILTNWKQSSPYNGMCPMDLNAGARSIAGCPAIAMAQIVNYHETLNSTTMNDNDDYYHSYTSGNQYWIDDDHEARGFPSWDSLNTWLTSLQYAYETQQPISTSMKAALCFACGVGAHSVYSASMSGTFGISQAWDSFQRFGFEESLVVYPEDTTFNSLIAENIKVGLPVQLGLRVDPPGNGGHNVVADGYNTDEFFHFNFGWGGGSNGWYTLPPTIIPYNLTIIEGAVIDIKSDNYTTIPVNGQGTNQVTVFPNPVREYLTVITPEYPVQIRIFTLSGQPCFATTLHQSANKLSLEQLSAGVYLIELVHNQTVLYSGKIIRE